MTDDPKPAAAATEPAASPIAPATSSPAGDGAQAQPSAASFAHEPASGAADAGGPTDDEAKSGGVSDVSTELRRTHRHDDEGDPPMLAPQDAHGEMAHVLPLSLLFTVFAALMVLTGITVAVTTIDLGPAANLAVALVVATLKAGLVLAIFMHLWFDRRFNLLVFLTSVLFVVLFIGLLTIDRAEYQPAIDLLEQQSVPVP